jgi:hypothetical protein
MEVDKALLPPYRPGHYQSSHHLTGLVEETTAHKFSKHLIRDLILLAYEQKITATRPSATANQLSRLEKKQAFNVFTC